MVIGVPVVILLFLFLFVYLNILSPSRVNRINGAAAMIADERKKLGAWTTAQKSTLIAALSAVVFWVTPGVLALLFGERSFEYQFLNSRLPEGVGALMAVVLLFLLPGNEKGERALSWEEAVKIDWGIIPLYGGGFALGVLALNTGLAQAAGEGLTALIPFSGETGLIIAGVIVALIISEISSNTASANMVVPVVIAIAQAQGINPFVPALAATMASSLGFMLPVSTPCNAIVYGSGYIPIMKMVRYGFLLDLFGAVSIITTMLILSWSIG
jgi:sodium-dependent dicarboxylate transporter 2/3/5